MLPASRTGKQLIFYFLAVVAPTLALLLQLALLRRNVEWPTYILFVLVVLLVAGREGVWAGIVATAVSAALVAYSILPQQGNFKFERLSDAFGLVLFCVTGVGISIIAELYLRSQRKSVDYEKQLAIQEARRASEQEFKTLANAIPQLCWMAGVDGKVFWRNERWYQFTGTTPEQMEGLGWHSVHDPKVLPTLLESWRAAVANGDPAEFLIPLRRADGVFRSFLTRAMPVRDREGNVVRWFGTSTDVSELRDAQEALRESELRFRALVTTTSEIVFSMSPDWREIRYLQGKSVLPDTTTPGPYWLQKYIQPDDQPWVTAAINRAIENKSTFELEHRMVRRDGSVGWVFSRAVPILNANGDLVEWFGSAMDITERKLSEERSNFLSAIVQSSYDAIIGKTLDGTITSWNPGAERLYGYTAAEMVGMPISLLLPFGAPNDIPALLQRVAKGEYVENSERIRRRKDGSLVEVSLRISPIVSATGKITGASTIARDITRQKRAQEALLRSEKLAVTGRLATTIAHEVNNPLSAAMNSVFIARFDPTRASEMLELAEQQLRRAAYITQQSLGFFREDTKNLAPLPGLVEEVLAVYATKLRDRNISVQRRYNCGLGSPGAPCPTHCRGCEECFTVSAGELRQIISNLLANGIDALPDGGIMQVRATRFMDRIQFTMADNGFGIRTENLRRIFEPFYTTKEFGVGLGLWVARELVKKHNGVIKVRSNSKGTVFRLTFPQEGRLSDSSGVRPASLPSVA